MDYFFEDVDTLVNYLFYKGIRSPLKVQKSLYFLYAFYGSSYGSVGKDDIHGEMEKIFPKRLFPGGFIATDYGPCMEDVRLKMRSYAYKSAQLPKERYDTEVLKYLDKLISQLLEATDFALVERSSEDKHFRASHPGVMDNDEIIYEYKKILYPDRMN